MMDTEDQLSAILGNPQIMQQIMSLAQSIGKPESGSQKPPENPEQDDRNPPSASSGGIDMAMLKAVSALAGNTGIDKDQRALLKALSPYVSRERIGKLERAMRAAKMAQQASGLLNTAAADRQKAGEGHV